MQKLNALLTLGTLDAGDGLWFNDVIAPLTARLVILNAIHSY